MVNQLKKQVTSQSMRYIPVDAREALTVADSSCRCSAQQSGEDTKLHAKQESDVWAGVGRAAWPDLVKTSAIIMCGADAGKFVKNLDNKIWIQRADDGKGP